MPITVKRLSDSTTYLIADAGPKTLVLSIKSNLRKNYLPKFPNGLF